MEQSGPDNIVDLVNIRQNSFDEPPLDICGFDGAGPVQPSLGSLHGPYEFWDLAAEGWGEVEVAISTVPWFVARFRLFLAHRGGSCGEVISWSRPVVDRCVPSDGSSSLIQMAGLGFDHGRRKSREVKGTGN